MAKAGNITVHVKVDPKSLERLKSLIADCERLAAHPSCRSCGYFDGTHSDACPRTYA